MLDTPRMSLLAPAKRGHEAVLDAIVGSPLLIGFDCI